MFQRVTCIKMLLALSAIALLTQCGGESKSNKVSFTIIPGEPIVITAKGKDGLGAEFDGPYFKFRVQAENNSDEVVTLIALNLELSISNAYGGEQTAEVTFTPDWANHTVTVADTDIDCVYSTFAELAPGETKELLYTPIAGSDAACSVYSGFIANSLPQVEDKFRYKVKMKPIGWFGDADDPTDRFERFISFFTR